MGLNTMVFRKKRKEVRTMRNLILGMKTVNETQIENEGFSHSNNLGVDYAGEDGGIDKWSCIDGDYKVIGIQPLSTTGFANTLFAIPVDANGHHEVCMTATYGAGLFTLAFAHQNNVNRKVGDIVKKGEILYLEGTAGRATGNHIHVELGVGYITKKIKQKDGKWVTPNGIAPSLNFFLLEGFHKVIKDKGIQYRWVGSIDTANSDSMPEDTNDLKIAELEKEVAVLNKKIIELEMKIKNAKEALA